MKRLGPLLLAALAAAAPARPGRGGNFYTQVIRESPMFDSGGIVDRTDLLEPHMRQKVMALIADAKAKGVRLMVYETYRSQERQTIIFRKGATRLRTVGPYHYGLACDLALDVNGQPSLDGDFSLVGPLARKHGLVWGGDWGQPGKRHAFVEPNRVQWCSVRDGARLAHGWYPDAGYDPYRRP